MKKLLLFASVCLMLSGCSRTNDIKRGVIVSKSYENEFGNEYPKGICLYHYDVDMGVGGYFQDSCSKYNIGDPLIKK